jgi:nucleoid-associated protein YgaU
MLLNNRFMLEKNRLIAMAEESHEAGNYDAAIEYAQEAIRFGHLSDDYVHLQLRIHLAETAINAARTRLDLAKETGAQNRYVQIYIRAESVFNEALFFRSAENWNSAREKALQVLVILAEIPDTIPLPAQYLVKTWASTRDCLWNIAAKPEIYGDPLKWPILYNANRDKLPRPNNPDLIHPGMILDIPSIDGEYRSGLMIE